MRGERTRFVCVANVACVMLISVLAHAITDSRCCVVIGDDNDQ